jgi:long-chain acyl-CoA synthetase
MDMEKMGKLTLPEMLKASFTKFAENTSLVFAGEENRTYAQLEDDIKMAVRQLKSIGISKGDKVAILSANMPNWGIAYFAIGSIGAVVVPILPDFHPNEIRNIIKHSEATAIYVSDGLAHKLLIEEYPQVQVIWIEDFTLYNAGACPPVEEQEAKNFVFENVDEEDLLSIIYTSGTTGKSKGVMLTHKNIVGTAQQSRGLHAVVPEDRFLSVLPLSHTLENTLVLILPVMFGASVHYLHKPPTASVLLPALKTVKPTTMLIVPLIIEKIFRNKILAGINEKWITRMLYKVAFFRRLLHRVAGKKLEQTFGGHLRFFGIGGAKLDDQVERFLMDAKFPIAIGYGMTEASPLLAGAVVGKTRYLSTGFAMPGVDLRIGNADPKTGEGEIQAQGLNIMKGYFKEPELTREAFTEDGWLRTGDRGCFDKNGYLYIKGRIKNMIIGSSGENIYPEEIESVINRMEYVLESLVIQQKGRLVAMVHLNYEEMEKRFMLMKEEAVQLFNEKTDEILNEIQKKVNEQLNKFSQINRVVLQPVPFEKTPTQKIKRFLYL